MKGKIFLCMVLISSMGLVACNDSTTETVIAPDTTAPLVLVTTPASGASEVTVNSMVSATFSETMNLTTFTTTTFTVNGVGGDNLAGTVNVSADNRTVTFTPAAPLTAGTTYTATLTTGVQDAAGNPLVSNVSWSFTTGTAPDIVAPTVSSVTPSHRSAANPATSTITATFNEALDCTSVTRDNVQLLEGASEVPLLLSCSDDTITLLPIYGMPTDTLLTAAIGPSVTDLAGNALVQPHQWSFGMAPWTRQFGTASDDYANSITTDAVGNVYVTGFTGDLMVNTDAFLTKYHSNGTQQWTLLLGTPSNDYAIAIALDPAGNVYVVGSTSGALDGQTSAGGDDLFVTKYDNNGSKQWTRQLGTASWDAASAITSDTDGNVYVTGFTFGALDGQTSAGGSDFFVTKYDTNGNIQWTRQLGTAFDERATAIASDAKGNIYVAGYTMGDIDGQTWVGAYDLFVTKYDGNGTKQWTRQLGTASEEYAYGIASDTTGNIYVAGETRGDLDGQTSAGYLDLFVTKYDGNGNKQWTRQFGTLSWDKATDITTDAAGNVYVAGNTAGALDGQANTGAFDLFVTKYDANGNKDWTRLLGSLTDDFTSAIDSDAAGNVHVAGSTTGTIDGQTSAGGYDAFIVKYQADGRKR